MRIIYISGSGRSGSTLLERILHTAVGCMAIGEFHCLWRIALADIRCACGDGAPNDRFWPQVMARAGIGAAEITELQQLEYRVARSSFIAEHGYDLERLRRSPEVQRFLELQFSVLSVIAEVSGRSIIVDSSKAGPRAWIMACDPRVTLLHLYRPPADVISSWRSRKFDKGLGRTMQRLSFYRAVTDWWKVEFLVRRLARSTPVHMVDYRELCRAPRTVIDRTVAELELPPSDPEAWLCHRRIVSPSDYHSLNGNPDRYDRQPIVIHQHKTDWSRHGIAEALAIRTLGGVLGTIYRAPTARLHWRRRADQLH